MKTLLFGLALFVHAQTPSSAPAPTQALQGQPPPSPGNVLRSPDGRWRWVEGEDSVFLRERDGGERRIRLPATKARRRVLFAADARHFCVLEETDRDFGLHVGARKGPRGAKALLLDSTLRLLDERGRTLWSKPLPDKAIVGRADDARSLSLAADGTVAILLQDVDPYNKVRPLLRVFRPDGSEAKNIDYAQWTRIDEFLLSPDGRTLVVRGFGLIPEDGDWAKAFGYYRLERRPSSPSETRDFVLALPQARDARLLRGFDKARWACCVEEGGKLQAFGPAGERAAIDEAEALRRFGPPLP